MANNPKNKGMYVKRPFCPSTPTTTSTVYNLTNHFSRLQQHQQQQQQPNTKSPKYPSSDALSHKVVSQQGKRVVLESGKEGEKPQEEEDGKKVVGLVVVNGGVERSRSFNGDAKVELSKFLMNNSAKLMAADMPPLIQIHAVGFARKIKDSLEKFTSKTLAFSLKKEFDGIYGPAWHCIVGSSFGSFVTHSSGGFLYFSLDQKLYILLFKTAVQRAD